MRRNHTFPLHCVFINDFCVNQNETEKLTSGESHNSARVVVLVGVLLTSKWTKLTVFSVVMMESSSSVCEESVGEDSCVSP